MRVIMFLFFMGRVHMLMGTMFTGVLVIMHMGIPGMLVGVRMLMDVLMRVGVRVLMGMHRISVPVLMVVVMGVFVGMQVLVFVLAFHDEPSRWSFFGASKGCLQGRARGPGPGAPGRFPTPGPLSLIALATLLATIPRTYCKPLSLRILSF